LKYADPDTVTARNRRILRAIDLNFKRKNLQDYAPDMVLEPFKKDFYPTIEKISERDEEYALANVHNK